MVDVMMPGEDGLALTGSLRQISSVPILLLTAMGEPEDRVEGLERGADDYMTKPFEPRKAGPADRNDPAAERIGGTRPRNFDRRI